MTGAYLYELGVTPYADGLALQRELAAARRQGAIPDTVLLLEHEPVITLGSRAVAGEELPLAPEEYARRGIAIVPVARGGRSTYHGPGQLVAYPIVDLRGLGLDLHAYVRALERAIVGTLAELGVTGGPREGAAFTGVWVEERKVASIGVHCARRVTTHGLALNVDLDLGVYDLFDACGLGGAAFTSVAAETGRDVAVADVRGPLARHLGEALSLALEPVPAAA